MVSCSSNANQIKIKSGQVFKCVVTLYLFSSNDSQIEVETSLQMNYHKLSSSSLNGKFIQIEIGNM